MAKARREFTSGIMELKDTWSNKIEKHMDEIDKGSERKGVLAFLAVIPHLLVLFFTVFIVWIAKPTSSIFSWHPTLMSLGFMFFMTEGILTYSQWFTLLPTSLREVKTRWHWILQASAMACAYTGLTAITYTKYSNDKLHYTTWHGTLGIIVCGTLALQASGGIIQMYPTILPFTVKRVWVKRLHAFSGSVTFSGGLLVLVLSLYSNWFNGKVDNEYLWGVCCLCPVVVFSAVFFQFVKNHLLQMFRRY